MGAGHPECPQRLDAIEDRLLITGLDQAIERREATPAALADLELAHSRMHLAALRGLSDNLRDDVAAGGHVVAQVVAQAAQGREVHARVGEFKVGQGGWRGLAALDGLVQASDQETVFDGVETLRAFGMPGPHLVSPTVLVGEISGGLAHHKTTVWFAACKPTRNFSSC